MKYSIMAVLLVALALLVLAGAMAWPVAAAVSAPVVLFVTVIGTLVFGGDSDDPNRIGGP